MRCASRVVPIHWQCSQSSDCSVSPAARGGVPVATRNRATGALFILKQAVTGLCAALRCLPCSPQAGHPSTLSRPRRLPSAGFSPTQSTSSTYLAYLWPETLIKGQCRLRLIQTATDKPHSQNAFDNSAEYASRLLCRHKAPEVQSSRCLDRSVSPGFSRC